MKKALIAAALLTLPLVACLEMETNHTLYLEPDGAITWNVLQRNVRSNEEDSAKARAEEAKFVTAVDGSRHDVAEAFRLLGGDEPVTRFLRRQRPFTIETQSRFTSIADLARNLLAKCELPARVDLRFEGDRRILDIEVDLPQQVDDDLDLGPLPVLLDDPEQTRLILTSGRFTRAEGWILEDGGTAARLVPLEPKPGDTVHLILEWTSALTN